MNLFWEFKKIFLKYWILFNFMNFNSECFKNNFYLIAF